MIQSRHGFTKNSNTFQMKINKNTNIRNRFQLTLTEVNQCLSDTGKSKFIRKETWSCVSLYIFLIISRNFRGKDFKILKCCIYHLQISEQLTKTKSFNQIIKFKDFWQITSVKWKNCCILHEEHEASFDDFIVSHER